MGMIIDIIKNRHIAGYHVSYLRRHGAGNLLPSEFLLDGRGKVVDIIRATKSNEHMSAERISKFVLQDELAKILPRSSSINGDYEIGFDVSGGLLQQRRGSDFCRIGVQN